VIDWLNKVINESIFLGAALIRVLNSESFEHAKFRRRQTPRARRHRDRYPQTLFVHDPDYHLLVGEHGHALRDDTRRLLHHPGFNDTLVLSQAFNNYIVILIFFFFFHIVIGFMSNVIAQAAHPTRESTKCLNTPDEKRRGTVSEPLTGRMMLKI